MEILVKKLVKRYSPWLEVRAYGFYDIWNRSTLMIVHCAFRPCLGDQELEERFVIHDPLVDAGRYEMQTDGMKLMFGSDVVFQADEILDELFMFDAYIREESPTFAGLEGTAQWGCV